MFFIPLRKVEEVPPPHHRLSYSLIFPTQSIHERIKAYTTILETSSQSISNRIFITSQLHAHKLYLSSYQNVLRRAMNLQYLLLLLLTPSKSGFHTNVFIYKRFPSTLCWKCIEYYFWGDFSAFLCRNALANCIYSNRQTWYIV